VIKPEPKPEPEPQAPAPKPKAPKQEEPEPEPPPEPPPDENKPEAPPVFDLSNDTFATQGGQGSSWALNRSEGNTKFAPVAGKNQGSVRGTAPDRGGAGKNAKQGRKTVALKDLSRRPEPKNGRIELPAYPLDLRRDGIEGPVVLQVFIDPNGRVSQARIVKEPGGGLGKIAQASMLKELWTPPLDKEGNPVATVIIYTYRFVLDG
jgi:TonB family protein